MKRCFLLACALSACLCAPAAALGDAAPPDGEPLPPSADAEAPLPPVEEGETPDSAADILLERPTPAYGPQVQEILFLPVGGSAAELALPETLTCDTNVQSEYGYTETYDCPILWDTAALDVTTAGHKAVSGQLAPEEGYALSEAFDGLVTHPVVITAPEMEAQPLRAVEHDGQRFYLMAAGAAPEELELCTTAAICYGAEEGQFFTCPVQWELSAVKAEPGVYQSTGTPLLPEGFFLPEGFVSLSAEVGVVSPDYVDLSAPSINPDDNSYAFFGWLYQPKDRASMILQYRIRDGEWADCPVDEYGVSRYGTILWNGMGMTLYFSQLEPLTPYSFRILYDENQVSNVLEVCITDTDFTMTVGGKGGDRDGGDHPPEQLPDYQQPSPPPHSGGHHRPHREPVVETVTEDSTTLSGVRLRQLTAMGETVLFEKHGVSVELSADFLEALQVADRDLLTVSIRRPEPFLFELQLLVNDRPVPELPGTTVRIPWDAPDAPELYLLPQETPLAGAVSQPENGVVSCAVSAAGTYALRAVPQPPVTPEPPVETPPEPAKPTEHIRTESLSSTVKKPASPAPAQPEPAAPPAPEAVPVAPEPPAPVEASLPQESADSAAPQEAPADHPWVLPALALLGAGAVLLTKLRRRHEA